MTTSRAHPCPNFAAGSRVMKFLACPTPRDQIILGQAPKDDESPDLGMGSGELGKLHSIVSLFIKR